MVAEEIGTEVPGEIDATADTHGGEHRRWDRDAAHPPSWRMEVISGTSIGRTT